MIRTLLVLFVAIVLQDVCTSTLEWHWILMMAGAIICLYIFKGLVGEEQENVEEGSNSQSETVNIDGIRSPVENTGEAATSTKNENLAGGIAC